MVSHSGLITVMTRAARKAAPRLRRDFGEVEQLQVSKKGPADFVSMADKRAEQTIIEELKNALQKIGEMQTALSNIMNALHQTAMNAIGNIR